MTQTLPTTTDFFCTDVSTDFDEPQVGTAVFAQTWLILEVREAWPPKAPADNNLPQPVQDWLNAQVAGVENGRIQFIRRNKVTDSLAFYIANAREQHPKLYRFELSSYDDLLDLDVTAVLANDPAYAAHQTNEPLVLICTHGRRDRCCAKFGIPVYEALKAELGDAVWQTTHLGGHRFAPTLVSLPDGVSYGRFTRDDVPHLIHSIANNQMYLDKLRGRCCYTAVTQFADFHLRKATSQNKLGIFQHISTQPLDDNQWQVAFLQPETNQTHQITIEAAKPLELYASSGSFKLKSVPQYKLEQISTSNYLKK